MKRISDLFGDVNAPYDPYSALDEDMDGGLKPARAKNFLMLQPAKIHKLISDDEMNALVARINGKDKNDAIAARNELVQNNLGLVMKIVKKI